MMSRLRNQDGFTLMETLTAVTVGFVVLAAILGLLESTVRINTGVLSKTDAMQRGRLAMDNLTQQLRSQVCLDFNNPAILKASTADSVTFYADYSWDGKTAPVKRTITFDPAKSEITSYRYDTPSTLMPPPATSYPATPKVKKIELSGVTRQVDAANQPVPFLRYYAYKKQADGRWLATDPLTPPLNDAQAARIARVEINYFVQAPGARTRNKGVNLSDEVMARHADPNLSVPDPNCV
jgi:type II secretory pathway pseudopilin PulG